MSFAPCFWLSSGSSFAKEGIRNWLWFVNFIICLLKSSDISDIVDLTLLSTAGDDDPMRKRMVMATKARRMKRRYRVEPAISASLSACAVSFLLVEWPDCPRDEESAMDEEVWLPGRLVPAAAVLRRSNDADSATNNRRYLMIQYERAAEERRREEVGERERTKEGVEPGRRAVVCGLAYQEGVTIYCASVAIFLDAQRARGQPRIALQVELSARDPARSEVAK